MKEIKIKIDDDNNISMATEGVNLLESIGILVYCAVRYGLDNSMPVPERN